MADLVRTLAVALMAWSNGAMQLNGEVDVRQPPERLFELLLDPVAVKRVLVDCEELVAETPQRWRLTFKVGSGFFATRLKGELELREAVWPTRLTARASGKMGGGSISVDTEIEFAPGAEPGTTRVRWSAAIQRTGLIDAAPEDLLRIKAEALVARFFAGLESEG